MAERGAESGRVEAWRFEEPEGVGPKETDVGPAVVEKDYGHSIMDRRETGDENGGQCEPATAGVG